MPTEKKKKKCKRKKWAENIKKMRVISKEIAWEFWQDIVILKEFLCTWHKFYLYNFGLCGNNLRNMEIAVIYIIQIMCI